MKLTRAITLALTLGVVAGWLGAKADDAWAPRALHMDGPGRYEHYQRRT